TELALAPDLARDARDLGRQGLELVDHCVDGVLDLEDLAPHVDGDLLREVAVRNGGRDVGDVPHLAGKIARHRVHRVGQLTPGAGDAVDVRLTAQAPFRADL